jgi:hypothetical protein
MKNVDFHQILRPLIPERKFGLQDGLQNAPRSAQDGSKTLLKTNFFALENRLKFGLVLAPISIDLGSRNAPLCAPFWPPKSIKKSIKNWAAQKVAPRSPQDRPRRPQDPPRAPEDPPRRHQGPTRAPQDPPRSLPRPPRNPPKEAPRVSR